MPTFLVVRFSSLGDIVLTEPIIRQLRQNFPGSEIHYLTKSRFGELLSMFDGIDRVHLWESEATESELISELRVVEFDLTIDLHNNIRSTKIRSSVGAKWVTTRKEWFKRFASVRMKWLHTKPSHAIERYGGALKSLGIRLNFDSPILNVGEGFRRKWVNVQGASNIPENYYVVAAGAAHETKQAPDALWELVANEIANENGSKALLVGAPSEKSSMEELKERLRQNCIGVLCDESIGLSAAAFAGARFVLSNDSGSAHLAAALGRPTLALFGPTHPVLGFAPRGPRAGFYTVDEYCSPCSLHGKRPCHREQRFCFSKMEAKKIVEQIKELVSKEVDVL